MSSTPSAPRWSKFSFELLNTPANRALGLGLPVAGFHHDELAHVPSRATGGGKLTIKRAEVMAQLQQAAGIGCQVHYPAIHLFALYRRLGWKDGDYPLAEYVGPQHPDNPALPRDDPRRCGARRRDPDGILRAHQK